MRPNPRRFCVEVWRRPLVNVILDTGDERRSYSSLDALMADLRRHLEIELEVATTKARELDL